MGLVDGIGFQIVLAWEEGGLAGLAVFPGGSWVEGEGGPTWVNLVQECTGCLFETGEDILFTRFKKFSQLRQGEPHGAIQYERERKG